MRCGAVGDVRRRSVHVLTRKRAPPACPLAHPPDPARPRPPPSAAARCPPRSLQGAVGLVSGTPAKVAKLHHVGSLEAGKRADVLLLSREPELRLEKVFVNGRLEFDAGMFPLPAELPPPLPPPAGAAAAGAAAASKATARR